MVTVRVHFRIPELSGTTDRGDRNVEMGQVPAEGEAVTLPVLLPYPEDTTAGPIWQEQTYYVRYVIHYPFGSMDDDTIVTTTGAVLNAEPFVYIVLRETRG